MKKTKYVVIDNDTKETVSIETPCYVTVQSWAESFNYDCHASGGSNTQYGIASLETKTKNETP